MLALSADERLLLDAVSGSRDAAVGPDIDWQRLVNAASWQRLLPLLWERLRGDPAAPAGVISALGRAARASAARNLRLAHERDRALRALADIGVPAMLLKGAALVTSVYANPAQRPMVDIDMLLPEPDLRRGHAAVAEVLGYEVVGARRSRDDDAQLSTSHHHYPLRSPDGAVLIELHQRMFDDRSGWDVVEFWDRAVKVDAVPPYLLQAPEDLMLHVASHFAFDRIHRGEGALGQIADLVRIARHYDLDWDAIVARARDARIADRLFLALMSASHLGCGLAPAAVTASVAPDSFTERRGAQFVRQRVLRSGPALPLEQLSLGRARLFARSEALERYVRPGEPLPSVARLRMRRWRALAGRLIRELPGPAALIKDIRLSRWTLSLRR